MITEKFSDLKKITLSKNTKKIITTSLITFVVFLFFIWLGVGMYVSVPAESRGELWPVFGMYVVFPALIFFFEAKRVHEILNGEEEADEGTYNFGVSITTSYFPHDNTPYFEGHKESILDWMRQYSKDQTESYLRGFLGKMLFSGDSVFKPVNVLSGGEKVRCMFSRMMMFGSNLLMIDQPTDHLDLESITAVNNGMQNFKGNILFSSHDYEIVNTVANRIIEITPDGFIDRRGTYEEYLEYKKSQNQ